MKLRLNFPGVLLLSMVLLLLSGCIGDVIKADMEIIFFEKIDCPDDNSYPKFLQELTMPFSEEIDHEKVNYGFTSLIIKREDLKDSRSIDYLKNITSNNNKLLAIERQLVQYYKHNVVDTSFFYKISSKSSHDLFISYLRGLKQKKEGVFLYSKNTDNLENDYEGFKLHTSINSLRNEIGTFLLKGQDIPVRILIVPDDEHQETDINPVFNDSSTEIATDDTKGKHKKTHNKKHPTENVETIPLPSIIPQCPEHIQSYLSFNNETGLLNCTITPANPSYSLILIVSDNVSFMPALMHIPLAHNETSFPNTKEHYNFLKEVQSHSFLYFKYQVTCDNQVSYSNSIGPLKYGCVYTGECQLMNR